MPEHVYKVVELVGSSEESVSKAIDRAIEKAALTLRHLGWFEVTNVRGHIEDGKVSHYQVTIKAGFRLEEEDSPHASRAPTQAVIASGAKQSR
jgi:dodecin